jgi:hypothetical protein
VEYNNIINYNNIIKNKNISKAFRSKDGFRYFNQDAYIMDDKEDKILFHNDTLFNEVRNQESVVESQEVMMIPAESQNEQSTYHSCNPLFQSTEHMNSKENSPHQGHGQDKSKRNEQK